MSRSIKTPIYSPLSAKFLRVVFSTYLLVAVAVTMIHIWVDYLDTKKNIVRNLVITQKAYEKGIARAIWYVDLDYLLAEFKGILENPEIVGVKIIDNKSNLYATGEIMKDADTANRKIGCSTLDLNGQNRRF